MVQTATSLVTAQLLYCAVCLTLKLLLMQQLLLLVCTVTTDGIPVIRATGVVGDDDMYFVANSGNYFNAPLVYAPYMPLMITSTIQDSRNPFRSRTAAGEWSAMKAVNPNLVIKLTITRN